MSEEKTVEEVVVETPMPEGNAGEAPKVDDKKIAGATVKEVWRQVESFGQTLGEALQGRGNVVMVRINDEALEHLDMLVEGEITKSRSESAAFLINEGIKANDPLFARIKAITQQITELREKLRHEVKLSNE